MENHLPSAEEQSQQEFLRLYDPSRYDLLSISVDNVVFGVNSKTEQNNYRKLDEQKLTVLLIKRREHPFIGKWSLPGGFVRKNETLKDAAVRVLNTKTGINDLYLEQLYTFGNPDRDPRMRIVSCAYLSLVDSGKFALNDIGFEPSWFEVELSEDGAELRLTSQTTKIAAPVKKEETKNGKMQTQVYSVTNNSQLAFDHASIILDALLRLRGKIEYSDIAFNLMPDKFTITQLQHVYEIILGQKLLAPAFRRKIESKLMATGEFTCQKGHRPSQYFKYKEVF